MTFDLLSFLNATNNVVTTAQTQAAADGLMRHAIALVGAQDHISLRDALKDQASLPNTYLSIYVAAKDELDGNSVSFDQTYAQGNLNPYKFNGTQLAYKVTYQAEDRFQYKDLFVDGLLSGTDYYYGIELVVDGVLQTGWLQGAFTTHGTAYSAPTLSDIAFSNPSDPYRLIYDIESVNMAGKDNLSVRFEVINSVLTNTGPREYIVERDEFFGPNGERFAIEDLPGSIYQRYVEYDIQIRFVSKTDSPVGVSAPLKLAQNIQIPWLDHFVDTVILDGGGIDQEILEDAAKRIAELTPAQRDALLAQLSEGDIKDIGSAYKALLKQAAIATVQSLEPAADAMRKQLMDLLYAANDQGVQAPGIYITLDLNDSDAQRVFKMITAPCYVREHHIDSVVRFSEGVFYITEDKDDQGVDTGLTRIVYVGQAAFERFFLKFSNR
ncbi:hypothetical protein HUZ36_14145 [Pseudoalteromonas sp. McH1-7]|uniref:Uncharacterized protein n=1 Tax=Pseudoalteromonas peptidolytica F12-50-A1 TaxID=1315280 RepID=A0A8I0MZ36_9GAMM|nr:MULTISPECIES: hypothetical protein [Pseudoalteromonas]MBE0347876.1 hypothetical protein [Pseudoalteromonas peptidolytica F12-50-A1]NLR15324.1 hypothetical protein [Pseudoalteromonas peptidolytica]NUZ11925.1 hypothetical protein [Pseudoalteromonas sp. McH1-7]GEK07996.1 hypothetical protein PPE03_02450 [Pseudoalteromonas peptidolytica]